MTGVKKANSKDEVNAIIQLRYKILREPWNKAIDTATDSMEDNSINAYIADNDGNVIACGRLQENEHKTGQIRYMAVDKAYQGKGLGKKITEFLEEEATKNGFSAIQLQARENAVEFYKKGGYQIVEKTFLLWDIIQHYLMEKKLR